MPAFVPVAVPHKCIAVVLPGDVSTLVGLGGVGEVR